ncbi:hypothetical protein L7F22_053691 [Adiantum nelumboides]|nr:hypothetical protein [Adiantum nelumboides]
MGSSPVCKYLAIFKSSVTPWMPNSRASGNSSFTPVTPIFGVALDKKSAPKWFFLALLKKKVSWYDREQNSSGVLMETFLEIATPISLVVTDFVGTMIKTTSILFVCLALALKASWPLALVMIATLPITTFGSLQRGKDVKCTHSKQMKKACANANIIAGEAISNMRTVASLTAEEKILDQFKQSLEGPLSINTKKSLHIGLIITLGHSSLLLSVCFILYVSALLVGAKKATFLRCLQASQVLTFAADSLGEAMFVAPILESAKKSFNTIASIIGPTMEEEENHDNGLTTMTAGRVQFVKVKFAYPSRPESLVLCNFNLDVPGGKTVALVGRSGCGKSSVLALLQRFYEPQRGQIRLDGIDISKLGISWLRQQVTLVQQQPVLFTGTIEENIRYGRDEATDAEVRDAARVANADGFVSTLPEGYKTQVGNKGVKLSGGQKQRIAIARAVLKQGRVMLLDEATSALDAESEGKVQEALERAAARTGATVLVVAHRLATVKSAHYIAVVEEGRVAEFGPHTLLIKRPAGLYAQLAQLQNACT